MTCPPLTAVIPLKALADAKGRLAPSLSPDRRRAIVIALFEHVLAVCLAAPAVDEVLVVAGDAEAAGLVAGSRARVLVPERGGLHAALTLADELLDDAAATIVVAADLPLLAVADLQALWSAAAAEAAVVIAPTTDGGTGGLVRRPARIMGTAYGPGSAQAHRVLAAEAGVHATVLPRPGFALDVDTAGELAALRWATASPPESVR